MTSVQVGTTLGITITPAVLPNPSLLAKLSEASQFLRSFIKDPTTVGSLAPSSKYLTREITQFVATEKTDQPRRYLEVGAGTGAFTEELVRRIKDHDHLDILDIDPQFCQLLRAKYGAKNIHVHCTPVEDFKPNATYDGIVSGLPLNSFSSSQVETILGALKRLTKPKGTISYYEYLWLPTIKSAWLRFSNTIKWSDFNRVRSLKNLFYDTYGRKKEYVFLNITPARVLHFVMP